jgi:flagellar hook assembly protein FlgD
LPRQLTAAWSPNPFNPSVTLRLAVPGPAPAEAAGTSAAAAAAAAVRVRVAIFDARGRRVRSLLDEPRPPGRYTLQWDGRDGAGTAMPSGVYLYRVEAGTESSAGKLTLLR